MSGGKRKREEIELEEGRKEKQEEKGKGEEEEEEYEYESVLCYCAITDRYLIQWAGEWQQSYTWEPTDDFDAHVNREQLPSYAQYIADVNDEQVAEKIRHDTYEQDEEMMCHSFNSHEQQRESNNHPLQIEH